MKSEEQKSLGSHRPEVHAEPSVPQSKHINCTTKDDQLDCVISEHVSQVANDDLSVHSLKSQQKQVQKQAVHEHDTFSVNSQSVRNNTAPLETLRYSPDELQNYLLASQLAPLLDRQGRFMMDVSRHFALYGANIQQILPQFNNYHNTSNLSIATNEGSQQDFSSRIFPPVC